MAEPVSDSTGTTRINPATPERPGATRLVSATFLMAAGTGLSRVLGFVKAALVVVALGSGSRQGDMFAVANVIPQAIYLLLAGGVLNTVFVPQIVRAMREHDDGGEAYTNRLLTLGLSAIGLIAVAATVLAPVIMGDIYLNARWKAPELSGQYNSIILLSYLCLPQIFFYGVNVMLGQVLNARGKFGPMMWSPIANNVVGIASIALFMVLWYDPHRDTGAPFTLAQTLVLGLGATLGIVAQAVILVPFMRTVGFRFRPRFDFRNSGLGRAAQVAKWTVGYMIVTQLALVVVTRLANGATINGHGAGWLVYQNANLIFMLPHSLITVSLTTAMLPSTSRLVVAGDLAGARDETVRTMRLAIAALLPAAIAFLALAAPISQVLFGHGKGTHQWPLIAWTLMAFAIGLVPFTLQYICLRAFYALEDTRTTFFVQILIASVNVAAAMALVMPFHRPDWVAPGLALAYAIAYIVGLGVSFHQLGRKLPGLSGSEIARHCLLVLLAVLPAGLAAYLIVWAMGLWSTAFPALVLALAVAGVVAVGIYLGLARLLRITEVNQIVSTLLRRGGRGRTGGTRRNAATGTEPTTSFDIDSSPSGGSDMTEALESGTIGTGTAGAAPRPTEASVAASIADEESVVTRIRHGIDNSAGQQHMAGGQSEQAAGVAPGRSDETPAEQTAPFSLDELSADNDSVPPRPVPGQVRGQAPPPAPAGHPGGVHDDPDHLPAGAVLADRYRLEELLAWTGVPNQVSAMVWRAFDQVLSRSVVIHLLQPGDPRSTDLLIAGRRAAGATDSRFLRVLDAVEEGGLTADGRTVGTYIVSEYAEGQSLQSVLAAAPLTGLESAWVIREVADALSGAHARGLFHRRLVPDMVIITPAGNIKIVGLLIEAALRPEEYPQRDPGADALEATDVTDLGRLLYACLVARWPGDGVDDLPAAPAATGTAVDSGHPWLTPRQVRHGVSPALDRICDQLLSPVPRQRAPRITTAAALVGELDRVLGTADATGDLERRLRHPQPSVLEEDPEVADYVAPVPEPEPYALIERNGSIAAGTNSSGKVATPASPNRPEVLDKPRPGPRVWVWLLVIVLLLAALVLTVLTARGLGPAAPLLTGSGNAKNQTKPTHSAPAPSRPLRIVDAHDFDPPQGNPPQGGNGEENPDLVKYAFDDNRSTDWHTLTYYGDPRFGRLKKGVGLVLDLGSAKPVGQVRLQLTGNGTDLQLRVPRGDAATTDQADMTSLKSWRTVAQQKGAGGSATLKPDGQVRTRYVLVLLTSLPKEGANYRGGIYEAEVLS